MVFIEEVAMSTLGNMMSYLLSSLILLAFMFYLNWQLGLIAALVTILALSLIHIFEEALYKSRARFSQITRHSPSAVNQTNAGKRAA